MIMIVISTLLLAVAADPLLFSAPLIAAPSFNPAYLASPVSAAITAAAVAPTTYTSTNLAPAAVAPTTYTSTNLAPAALAPVGLAPPVIASGLPSITPYSSVSSYVYGAGYSTQDYLVNPSAALTYGPYSLPYAYTADWYYRK